MLQIFLNVHFSLLGKCSKKAAVHFWINFTPLLKNVNNPFFVKPAERFSCKCDSDLKRKKKTEEKSLLKSNRKIT